MSFCVMNEQQCMYSSNMNAEGDSKPDRKTEGAECLIIEYNKFFLNYIHFQVTNVYRC